MKNGPHGAGGRSADDGTVRAAESRPPIPFRLVRVEPCEYGSKRALASISIDDLGELELDYFRPANGREPFVTARSVRDKYTGTWVRSVKLDPGFADALCAAIEERLAQLERVSEVP